MKIAALILIATFTFGVVGAKEYSNPLVFDNNRITIITDGLLRLEYAVDGKFHDDRTMFAWNREALCKDFKVTQGENNTYTIETARMKIVYRADGYPFGLLNFNVEFDNGGQKGVWNTRKSAFPSKVNLGGAVATLDLVDGRCNLDEGLLSLDGYYLIDDTGNERIVDGWLAERSKNHIQDYYIFIYGRDYRSALKSLGEISGYAPMNRKYMHGAWYCRFFDYNADDYRQILREYKQNNYPLDVLVFDMDWHTMDAKIGSGHGGRLSWTGYTWNRQQFPDPKGLLAEFKSQGIAVPLNDHPADGMRPHEEYYVDFMKSQGLDPVKDKSPVFDASSKKYMESFFRYALKPNEDIGAAFWWLDWQQNYIQPYVRGTKTKHLQWLNHLYYQHSLKGNDLRGAVYSRWGGWGSQRYPIHFSGDSFGTWPSLAFQVELTATSGNAACFYWAHDIGGHYKGDDAQMYVRWTQFGALSSTLRVHSAGEAPDRRPWLWGDWANKAMRRAYHLRSELMPYIYSSLWQTHSNMVPLNRAMYIDYPYAPKAYQNPQQYLFGDNIIAAPITSAGEGTDMTAQQSVWFPEGDEWYGYNDGKKYNSGTTAQVKASIYEIPFFVRGGVMIPMQPYTDRMATTQIDTLRALIYPSSRQGEKSTTLYEDDGISLGYTRNEYATTQMKTVIGNDILTLTIAPTQGSFDKQLDARSVVFELVGLAPDAKIVGKNIVVKPEANKTFVTTPRQSIRKGVQIEIHNPYKK